MQVDRPTFIVSPPRCGTSPLYRCLGDHPDVGSLNRANKKPPDHPGLAHFLTKIRVYRDPKRDSRAIRDRFLMPRYEDSCAEPLEVMGEVAEFAGLGWTPEDRAAMPTDVRDPSDRWKSRLGADTLREIGDAHGDVLSRYEHPAAGRGT